MFDYKLLTALEAVVKAGSFDKAAALLCITPSAVSQRIRQLEERTGQLLLIRSLPVRATAAGHRLLRHVRQVALLEEDLQQELQGEAEGGLTPLPVGVNADSLGTWLLPAVAGVVWRERFVLQAIVDDEAHTHDLLRSGEVVGCVTSHPQPPTGCISQPLGQMRYRFYATPDFVRNHLPDGLTREAVLATPGIAFNRKDSLHFGQMEARFGLRLGDYPYLTMPSTHALFEAVKAGLGYGLSPELQVGEALASGEVIDLLPDDPPSVSLYWHGWALQSPRLARFTATLVAEARQCLRGG